LAELQQLAPPTALVIRDGERDVLPASKVVVGDILLVEEGSQVVADVRWAEVMALQSVEASLTGESMPVTKTVLPLDHRVPLAERSNMGFLGTVISRGHGVGVVVRIGVHTEVGRLSRHLVTPTEESTRLQRRLTTLGKVLVVLSVVLCAVMVGVGFLRRYISTGSIQGEDVKELLKLGVSLAVSVIPEGLVAVVTITMALGVRHMAKRNAIVRQLPAVETLGAVTTLCADKTGTLTEGVMKASEFWAELSQRERYSSSIPKAPIHYASWKTFLKLFEWL